MIKREKILIVIMLFVSVNFFNCNIHQNDESRKQLFDLNWKFNISDQTLASGIDFNDQNWRSIDLPHDWSKDNELLISSAENASVSKSAEVGWYRKHFEIPENWMDKNILIDFEGISMRYEIFINGTSISDKQNKTNSFQAILNPYLNFDGKNVIAIRIIIPGESEKKLQPETGIYKHVWLVIKNKSENKFTKN